MKIAVLLNESAGGGAASQRRVMEKLKEQWLRHRLFGVRGYGGEYLSARALPAPDPELPYLPRLRAALGSLLEEKPDMILSVGGDGTAAYVAQQLIRLESRVPLAGLGSGTANVGPIVSLSLAKRLPPPEELQEESLGAIEALDHTGYHIAFGFNDLILGTTYLGTGREGTKTYDALSLAREGLVREAPPDKTIFAKEPGYFLNDKPLPSPPFIPAQIIAAPVEQDNFYGRAVTGLLCCTPGSPYQGAVYISPIPLVSMEENEAGYSAFLTGAQLLLQEGDGLRIQGLSPRACAVADGNPYQIQAGQVTLRYVPDCIRVLRGRQLYE